jgi:type VI secretion system (T6SS) baseplate-like injector VgrG
VSEPLEPIANTEPTRRAGVLVNGSGLPATIAPRLLRVVVDTDVRLPGMFELTFLDVKGTTLAEANIEIGAEVTVSGTGATGTVLPLIVGEVTAIEGIVQGVTMRTLVRGYTAVHRLQRARRSRSFLNSTDSDVARTIATDAGLTVGTIQPTTTTHAYLAQVNQTDWEFLTDRAQEIGYELGVSNGEFYFRPFGGMGTAGGIRGKVTSSLSDIGSGGSAVIKYPESLISFRPRITAGNLTPDVEARVWDPMARMAVAQAATTPDGTGTAPSTLGGQFVGRSTAGQLADTATDVVSDVLDPLAQATGGLVGSPVGYLGPQPSPTARVLADKPFADQTTMPTSGPVIAGAFGSDFGSTYAECEGECKGDAAIQPGGKVDIQGVQPMFGGTWTVSRARHVFDDSEYGYRVIFSAHGRQDRTMLGLTSKSGRRSGSRGVLDSVVCGVVSNCADPLGKGRIRVTLPWLSPDFETDWAPISQFYSGQRGGAVYMPQIGDEVLVAFEFGDARRPYVLGAFMNNLTQWSIAKSGPIGASGLADLNGVLASQAAGQAAGMAGAGLGAAAGMAVGGPLGAVVGAAVGGAIGGAAAGAATDGLTDASGATLAPGMISEAHHRGVVSNTGNALLFYDVPPPLPPPTAADVGGAIGVNTSGGGTGSTGGGTGSTAGPLTHPAMGALGSAVRLGSQDGEFGITIDQVNGGLSINAAPIPGVTLMPVPMVNIGTMDGLINIAAGAAGAVLIDGGTAININSTTAITLTAPTVDVVGLLTLNGVPIPL